MDSRTPATARRRFLHTAALAVATVGALIAHDDAARAGDAPRPVDAIENDLVADDPAVRAKAAAEFTGRFPDGAVAVPMLVDLLDDESPDVVAAAARTLEEMTTSGAVALVAYCSDPSRLATKGRYGESLDHAVASYASGQPFYGVEEAPDPANECLRGALLVPGENASEDWERALVGAHSRYDGDARRLAAAGLAMLGADALVERGIAPPTDARRAAAAKSLVSLIAGDDVLQSWCAARIARRLRTGTPELVAALAQTLVATKTTPECWRRGTYDDRKTPWRTARFDRMAAVEAIAAIGPSAAAAAPRLVEIAADQAIVSTTCDHDVEQLFGRAVRALVRVGREEEIRAILDRNPSNALFLARTAAESGAAAGIALPRLAAAAPTATFMDDVFRGLAALGPSASSALPVLRTRLRETKDESTKAEIARTIIAISPSDAEALDVLADGVKNMNLNTGDCRTDTGRAQWLALCEFASPTPRVVRLFVDDMNGKRHALSGWETVEALGRAGALAKDAVPGMLTFAASDYGAKWLEKIAVALGRIGPDAGAVVPLLTTLRDGKDETLRVAAAQALRRIRAKK